MELQPTTPLAGSTEEKYHVGAGQEWVENQATEAIKQDEHRSTDLNHSELRGDTF